VRVQGAAVRRDELSVGALVASPRKMQQLCLAVTRVPRGHAHSQEHRSPGSAKLIASTRVKRHFSSTLIEPTLSTNTRPATLRLPNSAHTSRPWRIHELASDFRVEDVWELPTPGQREDFPLLVQAIASGDPSHSASRAARALWTIRWKLGALLGLDRPDTGLGSRVPSLRDRLPVDLRDRPGPTFAALPFSSLYLLDDEFAAEIANRTMHGVLHLGWVPDETGGYHGQMTVLVRPNGLVGNAYMAAIRPFRHLIVYPAAIRQIGRQWASSLPER
jgi:hypothetical protein